jgi:S1-C subfamily serine protease
MKEKTFVKDLIESIVLGIVIGILIIFGIVQYQNKNATKLAIKELQNQIIDIQEAYNNLLDNDIELTKEIQEINRNIQKEPNIKQLLNSSVFVKSEFGLGAGTVIKKTETEMYVLTCYHVVAEIIEMNKKGYNTKPSVGYTKIDNLNRIAGMVVYGAKIIKYDEDNDLALLKINVIDDNLEVVSIAEIYPEQGETIYSVGNPLGFLRTISKGILSRITEKFYISDNTTTYGNSGGGLFNKDGELIGIPVQLGYIYNLEGSLSPETSLGKSVKLSIIKDFLEGAF